MAAFKKISKKIPVTFIGKNPPKELANIANGEDVNVPGFVDDVRPYFDRSKIYICPIKNGGGTRLKIIDALAMSKPLIATGMAVEGLDLVEGEHYLRAETGEDFVRRIEQMEDDNDLCRKLASAGRKYVEQKLFLGHYRGKDAPGL
jgi:glycosyltransferase involved in cell wall biosynthesis